MDPENAKARGLLGQVSFEHRWERPEIVSKLVKEDETLSAKLAEYTARRARLDRDTEIELRSIERLEEAKRFAEASKMRAVLNRKLAPEHEKIGLWCEENGLKAEALAHFMTALQLDPHHDAAWRHLGYVKHHHRWMSKEMIAEEEHEAQAQKHADRHWTPLLKKWAAELGNRHRRAEAEANLAKVRDPRAIPSIVHLFANGPPAAQMLAVRLLDQIDAPESSQRLAMIAVFGETAEIQQAAAEALKGRNPRDFGESLVDLIHAPMTYEYQQPHGHRVARRSGRRLAAVPRRAKLRHAPGLPP